MRYFFRVEYDGTGYSGWQRQKDSPTVQASLEDAFMTVLRRRCKVTGAGRTDAGVHAKAQGAHIDTDFEIDDPAGVEKSVNALLKKDAAVYSLQAVPDSFHARYSAVERCYVYRIVCRKRPLMFKKSWEVLYNVDWDIVAQNLRRFKGEHDFSAFCASGHSLKNMRCNVFEAELEVKDGVYSIAVSANRFLYKMVRNIVGTLVDSGRGRIKRDILSIIDSGRRDCAGETAPACGLVLNNVVYKEVCDERL